MIDEFFTFFENDDEEQEKPPRVVRNVDYIKKVKPLISKKEETLFQTCLVSFAHLLKQLDSIKSGAAPVLIYCNDSKERAFVHIACKKRGLFSIRSEPHKLAACCIGCGRKIGINAKRHGKYYASYSSSNGCECSRQVTDTENYSKAQLICVIDGVVVCADAGVLPPYKRKKHRRPRLIDVD